MASTLPIEPTSPRSTEPEPATYTADDVSVILGIALPSVYERARVEPERLGVIRLGRSVRFLRSAIDRLTRA